MMTGYYMTDSIWYVLSVIADNKEGDFIICMRNLSVMDVSVRQSSYGLKSLIRLMDLRLISAWNVAVLVLKI
jgi:hypothetical protein